MSRFNDTQVLFFIKAPRRGFVKTRLSPDLDPESIVSLYRCFVRDTLEMLERTPFSAAIHYHPPDATAEIADWLGGDIPIRPQIGGDLGAKMAGAFRSAFNEGCRRAVLMGSDLPDLSETILHRAFDRLKHRDMVLGPARDGGYYMIGFNDDSFSPELFQDMPWGTSDVFRQTLITAGRRRSRIHLLPEWRDMDTAADLRQLMRTGAGAPLTRDFLRKRGFG